MKFRTILLLPPLSLIWSFFSCDPIIACKLESHLDETNIQQKRATEKDLTELTVRSPAPQSWAAPLLPLNTSRHSAPPLFLKKIEHPELDQLFQAEDEEQRHNNSSIFFKQTEIHGIRAQVAPMNKLIVEQIRIFLQNSTTIAILANIDFQKKGLKKHKLPSTISYQLYCNGKIIHECKPVQMSFYQNE